MTKPDADPCPFCTSPDVLVWDKAIPGGWAVMCSNGLCAATGPVSMISWADAVRLWNRRN